MDSADFHMDTFSILLLQDTNLETQNFVQDNYEPPHQFVSLRDVEGGGVSDPVLTQPAPLPNWPSFENPTNLMGKAGASFDTIINVTNTNVEGNSTEHQVIQPLGLQSQTPRNISQPASLPVQSNSTFASTNMQIASNPAQTYPVQQLLQPPSGPVGPEERDPGTWSFQDTMRMLQLVSGKIQNYGFIIRAQVCWKDKVVLKCSPFYLVASIAGEVPDQEHSLTETIEVTSPMHQSYLDLLAQTGLGMPIYEGIVKLKFKLEDKNARFPPDGCRVIAGWNCWGKGI